MRSQAFFGANVPSLSPRVARSTKRPTGLAQTLAAGVCAFLLLMAPSVSAQSYSLLASFNNIDGSNPVGDPLIDSSGNVFGTTQTGGAAGCGVIYELVNNGGGSYTNTTLYNFAGGGKDGCNPYGGLVMDSSGNLYGSAPLDGEYAAGVIYELANSGGTYTESVIYAFKGHSDGAFPYGDLAMDAKGRLYGTTYNGAGGNCAFGCGTVFQLTNKSGLWTKKVLHLFKKNKVDGWYPAAGVALDSKGNIYGTTNFGGSAGVGTIFKLSPPAKKKTGYKETILHAFAGANDGCHPYSGVVPDSSGNFYGTTSGCGQFGYGTVYQLAPSGKTYTNNVIFQCNGGQGYWPYENAGFVAVDPSGNVYGTASLGGAYGYGTVFALAGGTFTFTDLHDFEGGGNDGLYPYGGVRLDSAGSLYGTTTGGGSAGGYGAVWQITSP
jgi:uncharacterized repeat protein (TIGR03803 family)